MAPKTPAGAKAKKAVKPKAAKPAETISLIGDWAKSHGKVKKDEGEMSDDDVVLKKPACKRPASAEDEGSGRERKDRNKNHHFRKCFHDLPTDIREQFQASTTRQQTVIINTLMEPGDKARSMVPVWDGKHIFEDCVL